MNYGDIKKKLVLESLHNIVNGLNKSESYDDKDMQMFSQMKNAVIVAIEKIDTIKY